jgi:radical SAM-linked protein
MDTLAQLSRYRIFYSKQGSLRYTGHLDTHHAWELSLRRARIPLAYSQGFHPQPRIQQACALPLGFTSLAEMIDIWLDERLPVEQLVSVLRESVPPGIEIQRITQVDIREPAMQTRVHTACYRVEFLESQEEVDLEEKIGQVLNAGELPRERRGKLYDLRPLIQTLQLIPVSGPETSPGLDMCLSASEGATGRPEEVLSVLGIDPFQVKIERTQ